LVGLSERLPKEFFRRRLSPPFRLCRFLYRFAGGGKISLPEFRIRHCRFRRHATPTRSRKLIGLFLQRVVSKTVSKDGINFLENLGDIENMQRTAIANAALWLASSESSFVTAPE
jgi:hypothetical protein